ncbi:hypothetical protein C7S17_5541 [Burkholderia thailandensis]|nr:hypothetical protein [Burkholderia thailandensis]
MHKPYWKSDQSCAALILSSRNPYRRTIQKTSATKMPASFIPPFTWRLRMTDRCGGRGFVCNARMAETTEHFDAAEMRERMNRR